MEILGVKDRRRRAVLGSLGGAALGLPFLDYFQARARAAVATRAKFIFFIYTPNGVDHTAPFWPKDGKVGETDFTLAGTTLEPLTPFRDKLLILGEQPGTNGGLVHVVQPPQHQPQICLTGDAVDQGYNPNGDLGLTGPTAGPSLDQLIASKIYPTKPRTPSLELGVHCVPQVGACTLNFALDGSPLPRSIDPGAVWSRVFGTPIDGTDPAAMTLRQRRVAVSNFLHKRFKILSDRLGKDDRVALDHHLQGLRDTEDRLFGTASQVGGSNCSMPAFAAIPKVPVVTDRGDSDANVPIAAWADTPALTANMIEVVRSAFACDLTRVATLSLGYEGGNFTGGIRPTWLGFDDPHHHLSHWAENNDANRPLLEEWRQLNRWFAAQVALALDRFQKTPYGTGTLLDQSIVYWFTRHGDGYQHDNHHLANVVAGGAGGYFRTGRFLKLPPTNNNKLLISLANAMGVEINQFGVKDTMTTGPIPGLV